MMMVVVGKRARLRTGVAVHTEALTRTRGGHRLLCYSDLLLKKTANDARHAHHWSFLSKAPSSVTFSNLTFSFVPPSGI